MTVGKVWVVGVGGGGVENGKTNKNIVLKLSAASLSVTLTAWKWQKVSSTRVSSYDLGI